MDTLSRPSRPWLLPVAIVLAGAIVAVATYLVRLHTEPALTTGDPERVRPVTPEDHLVGNPTAPVMVVEYGDIDSEYTKKFNAIMEQLMTEYAPEGKVAWVFRHFPIIALHPNAAIHASAAECAASLGTADAFWRFIDAIAADAPGVNQFDPRDYPSVTARLGIDQAAFERCIAAGTFEARVQDDYTNALLAGAEGSPYIVLMSEGMEPVPINGALPYQSMKEVLDRAVAQAAK